MWKLTNIPTRDQYLSTQLWWHYEIPNSANNNTDAQLRTTSIYNSVTHLIFVYLALKSIASDYIYTRLWQSQKWKVLMYGNKKANEIILLQNKVKASSKYANDVAIFVATYWALIIDVSHRLGKEAYNLNAQQIFKTLRLCTYVIKYIVLYLYYFCQPKWINAHRILFRL